MKQKAIIVDIDGTIADLTHRLHHMQVRPKRYEEFHGSAMGDKPIQITIDIITHLWEKDMYDVLFVTGRPEKIRQVTLDWLNEHTIYKSGPTLPEGGDGWRLFMRETDDKRQDPVVKREIYEQHIEPHYDVKLVFEDRRSVYKMWRELGLLTYAVAEGDF